MAETTGVVLKQSDVVLKCASCGGQRVFDPDTQKLRCEQCGTETELSESPTKQIVEYDFRSAEENLDPAWSAATHSFQCPSCGATTVLEAQATATRCAFCGEPQVVDTAAVPGIRPEAVVPFRVDRAKANEAFRAWLSKRFFAPAAVKREYLQDKISGVYLPYWTYDAGTESDYTGQAGDYYYVTESYNEIVNGKSMLRTRQVRKIRWRYIAGHYSEAFDDLLVPATKSIETKWLDKLEPFPLEALQPYRPDYLSGFSAERYGVDLKEGFAIAQQKMDVRIRQGITRQVAADEIRLATLDTHYTDITYKHLLLPLWISSYRYGLKTYRFLVNGHTAEVTGTYPVSVPKVLLTILAVLAALAVAYYFISQATGS